MTGTSPDEGSAAIDAYLAGLTDEQRVALERVRQTLRSILPHADEAIRYGMPALVLDGKAVAGYAASRDHCGYYPMSGDVVAEAGDLLDAYERSKGGIRFGFDQRLPKGLLRQLVKLRLAELAAVDNGRRTEYYDDGQLKAVGQMRDGKLHGNWKWFRRDGTLLRTGKFSHGEQVGTWTSYDGAGNPVKTTRY